MPILNLDDPAEVVAYVPYRLGFEPTESLVVVSVREPALHQHGLGLAARADLKDLTDPALGGQIQADIGHQLRQDDCIAAWLLVYGAAADPKGGNDSIRRLLSPWWSDPLLSPARTFLIGAKRWRCMECAHEPPCPPAGRSTQALASTAIAASMVVEGILVAPHRSSLIRVTADTAPGRLQAQQHRARLLRERNAGEGTHDRWRTDLARTWETALSSTGQPDPADCGRFLAGLEDVRIRDAIILAVMGDCTMTATLLHPAPAHPVAPAVRPPTLERMRRVTSLLESILTHAASAEAAPVWAVLAWCAWWNGDGARCDLLVAECEKIDPTYRLAGLLRRALTYRIPPTWVEQVAERQR